MGVLPTIKFKNGHKLISASDSITCQINQLVAGWEEGIKLIGKGGKIRLIIHPDLANKEQNIDHVPPNSVLLFEIELIDVIHESPFRVFIKKIKSLFGYID